MQQRRLDTWLDPEQAYLRLFASGARSFWLDSGVDAETGRSYAGTGSRLVTASVARGTVTVSDGAASTTEDGTIFEYLREHPGRLRVGWLGYELGAQTSGTPWHPSRYADAAFIEVDRMLEFDHTTRRVTAVEAGEMAETGGVTPDAFVWLDALTAADAARPAYQTGAVTSPTVSWRHDPERYRTMIDACREAIRRGDAYQLCLTNQLEADGTFDPVDVYLRLRRQSPAHHGGLVRCDGTALLSTSPEQFLRIDGDRTVTTKPIKGTRRRGVSPQEDDELRDELLASDKERAENLMIVDLMRNDLGRIAEVGTVSVPSLLAVESYAQVHQLVSTVRARMRDDVDVVDVIEACFPAGSMTGAPKISAIATLDGLEGGARGLYSGAFGMLGADGTADLAVVIRSIVIDEHGATIGTGGGITALSVPEEEIEETRVKARALIDALGLADR